jgi:CRP/FNR family cyclic AMP-dependent transcriptional regulator
MASADSFISQISIFTSLAPEDLASLPVLTKIITRETGQIIFREGDPALAMYVIRSGKVAISVWTKENEELVFAVLGEGDFFGETSLLDGSHRTATAKVVDAVELIEIGVDDFFKLLRLKPDIAISIMGVMARRLRATNELIQRRASRNVNQEVEMHSTLAERVADRIARWGGSWWFVCGFFLVIAGWTTFNTIQYYFTPFDSFPFVFLNLILSVLAALQAPVIMMSQNRDGQIDRLRADLDYQVNLKAELQIQNLHVKLDDLRASEIHELREIQRQQLEFMKKWEPPKN